MSELEHRIAVNVKTEYLPEQSSPQDLRFVFAYHISITNQGEHRTRLLTRHWVITDGEARTEEVFGCSSDVALIGLTRLSLICSHFSHFRRPYAHKTR